MSLKIISTNEYQDCIRIQDGFLLVINKFVVDDFETFDKRYKIPKNYYKKLNKGVNDDLWILTRPVKYWYTGVDENDNEIEKTDEFSIGTVFYNQKLIMKMDDPDLWDCYTRVAWGGSHAGASYWIYVSDAISTIMKKYKEQYSKSIETSK